MKKIIYSFLIITFLFVASTWASPVFAQTFKFELANPSQTISAGGSFEVKILINTGGEQAINGDALIVFESAKVSINSAESGNFFTYFTGTPLSGVANKYLVSSWEESVAHAKSSTTNTLFATLSLTAKLAGSTSLSFECTAGTEADSNINRASDSKDIINCSALSPLTINIGQAAGPTTPPGTSPTTPPGTSPTTPPAATQAPTAVPSPRPTNIPTSTSAPSYTSESGVSQLPRSGSTKTTFIAAGVGVLLTTIGIGVLFIL